jgi:hypothetical protein
LRILERVKDKTSGNSKIEIFDKDGIGYVFPILIGDEEKIPLLQKVQKRKNTQSLC